MKKNREESSVPSQCTTDTLEIPFNHSGYSYARIPMLAAHNHGMINVVIQKIYK